MSRRFRSEHSALIDLDALDLARSPAPASRPAIDLPIDPLAPLPGAQSAHPILAPTAAGACQPLRRRPPILLLALTASLIGGAALAAVGAVYVQSQRVAPADAAPSADTARSAVSPAPEASRIVATAPVVVPPPPAEEIVIQGPPAPEADAPPPDAAPVAQVETPKPERRKRPRRTVRTPKKPKPAPVVKATPTAVAAAAPKTAPAASAADVEKQRVMDEVSALLRETPSTPAGPTPPRVVEAAVELPARLTSGQIRRGVRPLLSRLNACPGDGLYHAKVTIVGAGRIDKAVVKGPDAAARLCVERVVRSARFPRFDGRPMTIELPFRI